MKFIDRVKRLEEIVIEKKEVPVDELISLLQVSPNYVAQLRKQVLRGGKVVEDWLFRFGDGKYIIQEERGEKTLFEKKHYEKLIDGQVKNGKSRL